MKRLLVLLALAGITVAQPVLRLKSNRQTRQTGASEIRRRDLGWSHRIVEIEGGITAEKLKALRERGVVPLRYIPDGAVLVLQRDDFAGVVDGALRSRPLATAEKISPLVDGLLIADGAASGVFVIEFHPDVEDGAARSILAECGLWVKENSDLLPHQLLARGTALEASRLAAWDEVAYIFPASEELLDGRPVAACAGPLTEFGQIGQYITQIGTGWDGAGAGSVELGYSLERSTDKLSAAIISSAIARALAEWSAVVLVKFTRVENPQAPRSLNMLFGAGTHGDAYPFDGPGRVLAHTFYPAPPNPEPLAGDLHFDADEDWGGTSLDLYSVALHELGHALGLGHSDQPGTVMYPYYRKFDKLTGEDIQAIQSMYAAGTTQNTPPATPDVPPSQPVIPPSPPPPPPPAPDPVRDTVAPAVSITSPATTSVSTQATSIVIRGTARDRVGVTRVTWTSSAGTSGIASGTTIWSSEAIPLMMGTTTITVRAYDAAGNSGWRTVSVTRPAYLRAVPVDRTGFPAQLPAAQRTDQRSSFAILEPGTKIVSSRSGPVEMQPASTPVCSSRKRR